jgi:hypothetical protein
MNLSTNNYCSYQAVSFIYHLFPVLQKSHDLIFIYLLGICDFNP